MKFTRIIFFVLMSLFVSVSFAQPITEDQVIELINFTASQIELNAEATLQKIAAGESPYKNKENSALYVFVFNMDLITVAHPNNNLMDGESKKGKPDIMGKLFRDDILRIAEDKGEGMVDYHFENPETHKIEKKNTYFKLVTGNDENNYIVCCGIYKKE